MPLDQSLRQSLAVLLTEGEPLGPIDQGDISNLDDARVILFGDAPAFATALSKDATLIIGRKGAGKSSILDEYKISAQGGVNRRPLRGRHNVQTQVIEIITWKHFFDMVRAVGRLLPHDATPGATLAPPEFVSEQWERIIWDEIIKHYYSACTQPGGAGSLNAVCNYIDRRDVNEDDISDPMRLSEALFKEAKANIIRYLDSNNERCLVLLDSMDDFPVNDPLFRRVTAGFLKCLNNLNRANQNITIVFCLPEEVEPSFSSSNIIKDYQKAHRIHWKPIDLLRITAHRYRLLIGVRDEEFYEEIEDLALDDREDIHKIFDRLLPQTVTNALSQDEDPLAYIIRHTQLLPRHIIYYFNEILRRNYKTTGGFRQIQPKSVVEGVKEVEKIVADHVLTPYAGLYPKFISACRDILPDLKPICTNSDLDKIVRRFKDRIEDDVTDVWHKLFDMGILGKVVPPNESCPDFIRSSRYVLGAFHYNIDVSFSVATDAEYCFHPIFSTYFGIARRESGDIRTVYPANVDDVTLSGLAAR